MMISLITVHDDLCTSCGMCSDVCPSGALTMKDSFPYARHPSACIYCGHCVAVCPEDALQHIGEKKGEFILKTPDSNNPVDFFATRRSIRRYTSQPIASDILQQLISIAETAPSGHNARKRQYHIVKTQYAIEKLEKITANHYRRLLNISPLILGFLSVVSPRKAKKMAKTFQGLKRLVAAADKGHNPFYRGVPCVIFLTAPKKQYTGKDDCLAAQQILMLRAHQLGLGTCSIGFALRAHKALEKYLNIPKNRQIYAVTIVGYPKYHYKKAIYRPVEKCIF
ncbi:MAG: nitroreductase family protein [Candidatus Marinimicrobia bacterium]|nr:nitroreductase family protein [Candidatus Neomarinimicrobiota bacterium]